jgi:hypothetical protein
MIYCIYSVYMYYYYYYIHLLYTVIIYIYILYIHYIYIHRCIFIQYINIHTYKKYGLYFHVYSNPYVILFQPAGRTTTTIILIFVVIGHRASSSSSQPKPFNPLNKVNHESPSTIMWLENSDDIASWLLALLKNRDIDHSSLHSSR